MNNKTVPVGNVTTVGAAGTTYKLTGLDLAVGASHELEVLNVEDHAENKVESLTETFSVEKDNAAAQGQVTTVSDNKILVKFDKPVVKSSLENVKFFGFNSGDGGFTTPITPDMDDDVVMVDKLGKEWLFTLPGASGFYPTNVDAKEVLVKANKFVIDTSGNLTKTFEEKVTLTKDVTGPTLDNIDMDKNSKGEVEKLYFEFDELLTVDANGVLQTNVTGTAVDVDVADVDTYFTLVNNEDNQEPDFTDVFGTPLSIELANDGVTVIVTIDSANEKVTGGNYKVTTEKGFVIDTAATPNDSKEVTKDLNIGKVEKVVKATPTVGSANDFTVNFNKEITAASAKNPANYKFDGKVLPADTKIVVGTQQVTFTLPEGFIKEDTDKAKLTINNIKPVDSAYTYENYTGVIDVLDNTRPEATGKLLSNGEIFITFSEAVDTPALADFDKVNVNGLELTKDTDVYTVGAATTSEGAHAVKITVEANTETVDGFTYLYIDVDNDGSFKHDKDIVLAKVSGAIGAEAWYTDGTTVDGATETDSDLKPADLNKVVSVEVITVDQDNTATEDKSIKANKLKAGTITIK